MTNTVLQHFYEYMEEIARAEQSGDYKTIFEAVRNAQKLPDVGGFQSWLVEYHKTATMLRYGAESLQRREKLGERLLELRDQARQMQAGDFVQVKGAYLSLLVLVLQKNFENMETFPRYEELALEMLAFVERGEYRQDGMSDDDLLPYAALGEYYARKGRFSSSERYYTYIWEAVWDRESLSVSAFFCVLCYIDWLCGNGDLPQVQKAVEELQDRLVSGRVQENGQKKGLILRISAQRFFGNISALLELAGEKELALQMMQELMARELLSVDAKRDGMLIVSCCYLEVLHEQKKKCGVLEQMKMRGILSESERKDFSRLPLWIQSDFYRACYNLNYMKNPQKAKNSLDRAVQVLGEEGFPEQDRLFYLNQMVSAVREYQEYGEMQRACECSDELFHRLAKFYSLTENYADNERLDHHLAICRLEFRAAYHAARKVAEPQRCMEYSLNFKNILGTAIRLRDRAKQEKRMMHRKEVPEFTYYGLQQLMDQIPEDTAAADLVCVEPESGQKQCRWDVSVMAKSGGEIRFTHYEMTGERGWHPLQSDLQEAAHLWICPDGDVSDLPQELTAGRRTDGKKQDVVYWQSLRDIFEVRNEEEEQLGGSYEISTIKG